MEKDEKEQSTARALNLTIIVMIGLSIIVLVSGLVIYLRKS